MRKKTKEPPKPGRYFASCANCGLTFWAKEEWQMVARCCKCGAIVTWNDDEKLKSFTLEEKK